MSVDNTVRTSDIYVACEQALLCADPPLKSQMCAELYGFWMNASEQERSAAMVDTGASKIRTLESPGRPDAPALVDARQLAKRSLGSPQGRIALIHSLAHIEFNAINLAIDAVYRFRGMPAEYVEDWLRVASEEGEHFMLLHHRLKSLDTWYGQLPAHDGLWDMARGTDHDVLVRMALVPRILEARGLDVAPPMIDKLRHMKDEETADILLRIYTDEITHVAVGNRWFRYVCAQRKLDGTAVFQDLLKEGTNSAYLRSPFNREARLQAGFTEQELEVIKEMEREYKEWQRLKTASDG